MLQDVDLALGLIDCGFFDEFKPCPSALARGHSTENRRL